jgi:hypothetical protein
MKKLMIALIFGLVLVPLSAWGQKWIEPYTEKDGTQVEGHWQTQEDIRKDQHSTPGKVNPYTGQFNPYTGSFKGPQAANPTPATPTPTNQNPYFPKQDYRYQGSQPANPTPPGQNPYYPQPDHRYQGR